MGTPNSKSRDEYEYRTKFYVGSVLNSRVEHGVTREFPDETPRGVSPSSLKATASPRCHKNSALWFTANPARDNT
jgi:hypothetical protein